MEERERREERKGEGNSTKKNMNENIKKFREKVLNTTALKHMKQTGRKRKLKKNIVKHGTWNGTMKDHDGNEYAIECK